MIFYTILSIFGKSAMLIIKILKHLINILLILDIYWLYTLDSHDFFISYHGSLPAWYFILEYFNYDDFVILILCFIALYYLYSWFIDLSNIILPITIINNSSIIIILCNKLFMEHLNILLNISIGFSIIIIQIMIALNDLEMAIYFEKASIITVVLYYLLERNGFFSFLGSIFTSK